MNKELLERVAVSDAHSQKLDYEMKDAAEKSKTLVESLQQSLAEEKNNVQSQKELLRQEKVIHIYIYMYNNFVRSRKFNNCYHGINNTPTVVI